MAWRKGSAKLSRTVALSGRPKRLPYLRRQEQDGGRVRVTVRIRRAGWARWLGGDGEIERTFALDRLGREVYDACDGKTPTRQIIRRFAAAHKVSVAEAEASVAAFLKTLMSKGLIAVLLDEGKH